jgi:alpha-D-xyloside xylohydrolase
MKFHALFLLLFAPALFAAPFAVTSFQRNPDGVTFATSSGAMKIQVCTDRIVRVVCSPTNKIPATKSFAITRDWQRVPFKVKENADAVTITTRDLQVRFNRNTGAVTFLDKTGKVMLAENSGARRFTPRGEFFTAEDSFASPPDEFLYGLGQYQEGLWNWRGVPRELHQHNMTATLPVVVSSRGYGLLWDNASLTDFDPLDNEIPLTLEEDSGATNSAGRAPTISTWHGTFTSGAAGEYVFFAQRDNNRGEFSVLVDGREIAGISNYWTPFSLCGKVRLPANTACTVTIRGGGKNVKLTAGLPGDATTFRSQFAQAIDYTFFYGPELDDVIRGYRLATGDAPMWPEWAFGFWQCRERYSSQQQLLDAAAEFRRRGLPLDLIVQDWKYWGTNGWGSYEWDLKNYPDPAGMIEKLHAQNVKFMISVWCNPHGRTLADLKQDNALVGEWVDVYGPAGRDIRWKHLNDAFFKIGTDAWWGDATEPGDTGNALAGKKTFLGAGDFLRNAYPLFASQSIYEGQRATSPDKRVCILTRSAFPGLQRYASAIWSGDISGNWLMFQRQIPAGLNFCLAGIPYWTTDCGGFWHPADQYTSPDYNELLARWFEWSAFCPVLRIHGGGTETEMWKWLPETQRILLAYDELRHRMLPYNYSVAWRVTSDGYTMMRALPLDFRADEKVLNISDEYMFGPAFLVAPVTEPQATNKTVYLPAGTSWVNFWSGDNFDGGQTIAAAAPLEQMPLFVRAGSIVPLGPLVQFAGEKPADPLELRVYRGTDGTFTLYEDEGDNYNYERGVHATIPISWNEKSETLTIGKRKGKFPGMLEQREFRVVFVSPKHGIGRAATEKADAEVIYRGGVLKIAARG